jgi:hypothetical protein
MPRKIQIGDRLEGLPAESWNDFCDAYEAIIGARPNTRGIRGQGYQYGVRVPIKNSSGSGITTRYGILRINDLLLDYDDDAGVVEYSPYLDGNTPLTDEDERDNFVVLQGPVASTEIGVAVIRGLTWCQVDITDANHRFCKPKASTAELGSACFGAAEILVKQSGTGTKWCLIDIDGRCPATIMAKTKSGGIDALANDDQPGSASCDVYYYDTSLTTPELADSGEDLTIYNMSSSDVEGTTWIHAKREPNSKLWFVDFEDCG